MHILLTGASSFTGAWFGTLLAARGHIVTGTLRRAADDYPALATQRLAMMRGVGVRLVERTTFGDERFLALLGEGHDLLCHHAAEVRDYRSADFDVTAALISNTRNIRKVCERAVGAGVRRLVATGTVFEQGEGAGGQVDRAVLPYALSKGLSWQLIRFEAERSGLAAAKFVIPNPFGRYEEERFCTYLVRCWAEGRAAAVSAPAYVRDNIPVDKLAQAYADFAELLPDHPGAARSNPSGYVARQDDFARLFAREIGLRLAIDTPIEIGRQTEFPEPQVRINTDRVAAGWDEAAFWNDLADSYRVRFGIGQRGLLHRTNALTRR